MYLHTHTHTMSHQTYYCHQPFFTNTPGTMCMTGKKANKKTDWRQNGSRMAMAPCRQRKHLTLDLPDQGDVFMLSVMESQTGTEVNKPFYCKQLLFCGLHDALCWWVKPTLLKREREWSQITVSLHFTSHILSISWLPDITKYFIGVSCVRNEQHYLQKSLPSDWKVNNAAGITEASAELLNVLCKAGIPSLHTRSDLRCNRRLERGDKRISLRKGCRVF